MGRDPGPPLPAADLPIDARTVVALAATVVAVRVELHDELEGRQTVRLRPQANTALTSQEDFR